MGNKEVAHHGGKRDKPWRKLIVDVGTEKSHCLCDVLPEWSGYRR